MECAIPETFEEAKSITNSLHWTKRTDWILIESPGGDYVYKLPITLDETKDLSDNEFAEVVFTIAKECIDEMFGKDKTN